MCKTEVSKHRQKWPSPISIVTSYQEGRHLRGEDYPIYCKSSPYAHHFIQLTLSLHFVLENCYRAEELRGGLMAAAAPHRERRGSAELCSVWQRQGPRERHGDVRGGAAGGEGKGLHHRTVGMERAAQGCGHSPVCWSSGSIWTMRSDMGSGFGGGAVWSQEWAHSTSGYSVIVCLTGDVQAETPRIQNKYFVWSLYLCGGLILSGCHTHLLSHSLTLHQQQNRRRKQDEKARRSR